MSATEQPIRIAVRYDDAAPGTYWRRGVARTPRGLAEEVRKAAEQAASVGYEIVACVVTVKRGEK